MGRKVFDCRDVPKDSSVAGADCVLAIVGTDEEEVIEHQVQHGIAVHGGQDTPAVREWVRSRIRDEREWARSLLE